MVLSDDKGECRTDGRMRECGLRKEVEGASQRWEAHEGFETEMSAGLRELTRCLKGWFGSSKEDDGETEAGKGWRAAKVDGENMGSVGEKSLKAEKDDAVVDDCVLTSKGEGIEMGDDGDGAEKSGSFIQFM